MNGLSSIGISNLIWVMGGIAPIDPATLALTAYWTASYGGSPWTNTASAGTSGSNDSLTNATAPAVGSAVNGFTPADFNGTTHRLSNPTQATSDFINNNSGSIGVFFNADSSVADAGAGSPHNNEMLICENQGYFGIGFSNNGVRPWIYDAGYVELTVACGTAGWHFAQMKWDGSTLKARVDNGIWSSISCGTIDSMATGLILGMNTTIGSAFFDGKIADTIITDIVLSDDTFNGLYVYFKNKYAL